jgi:hypothetical protein
MLRNLQRKETMNGMSGNQLISGSSCTALVAVVCAVLDGKSVRMVA